MDEENLHDQVIRYRWVILWPFEKIVYFVLQSTVFDVASVSSIVDRFAEQRTSWLHVIRRFTSTAGDSSGRRPAIKPTSPLVAVWPDVTVGGGRWQIEVNAQLGGSCGTESCPLW